MPKSAAQQHSPALQHTLRMEASLGLPAKFSGPDDRQSALGSWANSGAMALTGRDRPLPISAPLASAMRGCFQLFRSLNSELSAIFPADFAAEKLLSERAAIAGYTRQGNITCGGACRLLETRDGAIALNLARDEDWELLPALFAAAADACDVQTGDWEALAQLVSKQSSVRLIQSGTDLGLAIADVYQAANPRRWLELQYQTTVTRNQDPPLVLDLSSLWAGPLCGSLLTAAGARVIKVESASRPDGARLGPEVFFHLMNQNKESFAPDLKTGLGRRQLIALLEKADIVIESARPRALRQMGIDAERLVQQQPGKIWVSLTGYGRAPEQEMRIAYGDDAGVAAGLTKALYEQHPEAGYLFCGDAIADPLTGLHAAVAASACWHSGRGGLLDISLTDVVRFCSEPSVAVDGCQVKLKQGQWYLNCGDEKLIIAEPRARAPSSQAPTLGMHNDAIIREFGLPTC